ncbi:unnamed protein product [Protopolystoma xenopodis]|uniref:Uncharacterized protein n=1 Tax=Protopolystoma xenopodis TaxID=117903 RepID=A0A3S5FF87_9PLAT|nr:unnamed protein product [Protopolystoma xenopodis]
MHCIKIRKATNYDDLSNECDQTNNEPAALIKSFKGNDTTLGTNIASQSTSRTTKRPAEKITNSQLNFQVSEGRHNPPLLSSIKRRRLDHEPSLNQKSHSTKHVEPARVLCTNTSSRESRFSTFNPQHLHQEPLHVKLLHRSSCSPPHHIDKQRRLHMPLQAKQTSYVPHKHLCKKACEKRCPPITSHRDIVTSNPELPKSPVVSSQHSSVRELATGPFRHGVNAISYSGRASDALSRHTNLGYTSRIGSVSRATDNTRSMQSTYQGPPTFKFPESNMRSG